MFKNPLDNYNLSKKSGSNSNQPYVSNYKNLEYQVSTLQQDNASINNNNDDYKFKTQYGFNGLNAKPISQNYHYKKNKVSNSPDHKIDNSSSSILERESNMISNLLIVKVC